MDRSLIELFPVTPRTRLDPEFLGGLVREIGARLAELEVLKQGLDAAIAAAQDIALLRVNEIIGPAQEDLTARLAETQAALEAAQALLADLSDDQFAISQIDGLQAALDGKSDPADLNNLETRARLFSLWTGA